MELGLRNFWSSSFSTEGATYIPMAAITLGIGSHSNVCFLACVLKHITLVIRLVVLYCMSTLSNHAIKTTSTNNASARPQVVQSTTCPVRELIYWQSASCPVTVETAMVAAEFTLLSPVSQSNEYTLSSLLCVCHVKTSEEFAASQQKTDNYIRCI